MRSSVVKAIAVLSVSVLAACSDEATRPTGPVTIKFMTPIFKNVGATTFDSVRATVIMDGTITVLAPFDTIPNVARGLHTFEIRTDVEYLTSKVTLQIDPLGSVSILNLRPTSCRVYELDDTYCDGRNFVAWSGTRIYCPVNDYGEFCAFAADRLRLGGTWPMDNEATAENEYIAHGKLMIGAVVGGQRMATAFYDYGDYSPRTRLHAVTGEAGTWQSEAWTDVRHVPMYPNDEAILAVNDRADERLGLSVRTTYVLPTAQKDVMYMRFDVTNISDNADYRFVNPTEPEGGHTVSDVYLAPLIDPDVGGIKIRNGIRVDDAVDDNATVFPNDSVVVAYDQHFAVPYFGSPYNSRPGLVGMRLISAPSTPSPSRALMLDGATKMTYGIDASAAALEDSTYFVISGEKGGDRNNCSLDASSIALICGASPETAHNVMMGWSIGPIASIAPGQTVSVTVAIIFASPTGAITSGNSLAPQNTDVTNTTRPIYGIGADLRLLANAVKGFVVNGTAR
jgi:hypothetical protein